MTSALCRTKGRMSSPAPKRSPTSFIAGSSTSLRTGTAPSSCDAAVDPVLDALLAAPEDVEVQRLGGGHPGRRVRDGLAPPRLPLASTVGDEALERVLAAVEDEVVGQLALAVADLRVRRDVVRVDHRQVEPGLDAVVQEDAVEDRPRRRRDAEAHVRHAERRQAAGQRRLDLPDALDRLDRARAPLGVAGRQRERQQVEDQQLAGQPVLVAQLSRSARRSRACAPPSAPSPARRW